MLRTDRSLVFVSLCLASMLLHGCASAPSQFLSGGPANQSGLISDPANSIGFTQPPIQSRYIYTLSGEKPDGFGRIVGYRLDEASGRTIPASSTPFSRQGGTPTALNLSGSLLYAGSRTGSVAAFRIGADGQLDQLQNPTILTDLVGPPPISGLQVTPGGTHGFALSTNGNGEIFPLLLTPANGVIQQNGVPTPLTSSQNLRMILDPTGNILFVISGHSVLSFSVTPSGSLVPAGTLAAGSPVEMATDASGHFLYVLDSAANQLSQYAVSPAGALSPLSPPLLSTALGPQKVALSPNGHALYVGADGNGSPSVAAYAIDANGLLTPSGAAVSVGGHIGGLRALGVDASSRSLYLVGNQSAFALRAYTLAHIPLAPDGSVSPGITLDSALAGDSPDLKIFTGTGPAHVTPLAAYVCCDIGDSLIMSYAIQATGALLQQGFGVQLATQGPRCLATATLIDGNHALYVGDSTADSLAAGHVSSVHVNPDGTPGSLINNLKPIQGFAPPKSLAIDPSNRFLFILNSDDASSTIITADIQSDGSLLQRGLESRYRASFPRGSKLISDPRGGLLYLVATVGAGSIHALSIAVSPTGDLSAGVATSPTTSATASGGVFGHRLGILEVAFHGSNEIQPWVLTDYLGALIAPSGPTTTGASPVAITTDPLNNLLFLPIAGSLPHLETYLQTNGGTLQSLGISDITANAIFQPIALTVEPSGQFLYVVGSGANNQLPFGSISQYTIRPAGPLLVPNTNDAQTSQQPSDILSIGTIQ